MNIATGGLKTLLVTFGDTGSVRGTLGGACLGLLYMTLAIECSDNATVTVGQL